MMNDKMLLWNFDSDRVKSEINRDIGVLKIRQQLALAIQCSEIVLK